MRPVVYSMKKYEKKGISWNREGFKIQYKKNNIYKDNYNGGRTYNTLSFMYKFEYD